MYQDVKLRKTRIGRQLTTIACRLDTYFGLAVKYEDVVVLETSPDFKKNRSIVYPLSSESLWNSDVVKKPCSC